MTRTAAIVLALSLLINEVHLLIDVVCSLFESDGSKCTLESVEPSKDRCKLSIESSTDPGHCQLGSVPRTCLPSAKVLKDHYLESNLVYLLSTSLILKEYVNVIPSKLQTLCPIGCFVLELLISLILLECSLVYVWKIIQHYLLLHSDDLLVHLSEDQGLDWVVCHLCCGHTNCSEIFAALVLKVASVALLLAVCCYTGIK